MEFRFWPQSIRARHSGKREVEMKEKVKILGVLALGIVLALPVLVAVSAASQAEDEEMIEERYRAFAVNMGAMGAGRNTTIDIAITRWSTEAEREALLATLIELGHDKFTDLLRSKEEVGWARSQGAASRGSFPSTRIHYSRVVELEDGTRQITMVTNRPMGMREVAGGSRSVDYNVSLLQFTMPPGEDAKGTGQLYVGLKVRWDADKKQISAEQMNTEPVRLTQVAQVK